MDIRSLILLGGHAGRQHLPLQNVMRERRVVRLQWRWPPREGHGRWSARSWLQRLRFVRRTLQHPNRHCLIRELTEPHRVAGGNTEHVEHIRTKLSDGHGSAGRVRDHLRRPQHHGAPRTVSISQRRGTRRLQESQPLALLRIQVVRYRPAFLVDLPELKHEADAPLLQQPARGRRHPAQVDRGGRAMTDHWHRWLPEHGWDRKVTVEYIDHALDGDGPTEGVLRRRRR
mmetsp:Transcript_10049/g.31686  ORF Transcript_10049/g.31686 Transcript_10049/m.31686 type:complete len:229 (-) Transcript_10049:305-991(-)